MARVTVIIPTHNRAEFLRGAITSVLDQTFQDFDIIVVDDASTDSTGDVVKSFGNGKIKYLRHDINRGGSAARNTGIVNSKGEFVAFLDDDDEWLPEKLTRQVSLFDTTGTNVGAVYTGCVAVNRANGKILGQKCCTKKGDLSRELFTTNYLGSASAVVVRKKCFETVGGFDERLPSFQDYDMWIRIARVFHIDYINEPLFRYYVHGIKIWKNPGTLHSGLNIMLDKYGDSHAFRRHCASYFLSIGVQYCDYADTRRGREAFLQAIKLDPFEIRNYFNFCLALLGPDKFKKVKKAKDQVLGSLWTRGRLDRIGK